MSTVSMNEQQVKDLLKQAIVELLEERQGIFQDFIAETIEDIALVAAIKEGEESETVDRQDVFQVLESAA